MKPKRGRPFLKEGEKKLYQRIAIRPETYRKLSLLANEEDINLMDCLEKIINKITIKG